MGENEQKKDVRFTKPDQVVAVSAVWWFSSGLAAGMLIGLMISRVLLDSYRLQ